MDCFKIKSQMKSCWAPDASPDLFFCPQLAHLMSQFQYFVCPVEFNSDTNRFTVECEPSDLFVMHEYSLPAGLQNVSSWVRFYSRRCFDPEPFGVSDKLKAVRSVGDDAHLTRSSCLFSRKPCACTPSPSTACSCPPLRLSSGRSVASSPAASSERSRSK